MRILIVEDEAELARLVASALGRAGFAVDWAASLALARDTLAVVTYDAVVLDLGLVDGNGLDLLRELRRRRDPVAVLILTARDTLDERVHGLDSGADDYLVKPFEMRELLSRIRALLRRPSAALGVRLEVANITFDTVHRELRVDNRVIRLSARELALLEMLLRRSGRVVAREAIENGIYSFVDNLGSNAIEVLVHRLRRKLGETGARIEIHTLRGVGYLLAEAAAV